MKKEIIVGSFLILMLAAALVNIHFLTKLTDHVTELIEAAQTYAAEEKWDEAEKKIEEAARLWEGSDTYIHLVLRHPEVESATDSIYGLQAEIYAKESGAAKGAAQAVIARMKSLSSIEQVKFGSIF